MNRKKAGFRKNFRLTATHVVAIFGCIWTVFPLVWMLSTSLKFEGDIFSMPPKWIPNPLTFKNYADAFTLISFFRYFFNSLIVCAIKIAGEVFVSALVAYGFSRFDFKFKNVLFMILMATLMIPGEATLIPSYIMFSKFKLINTYFPIAWSSFFGGSATFIFFYRMYFSSIPNALDESAYIDGANSFQIFWKIILPISKPAMVSIGVLAFMGGWNDLLGPLIYLNDEKKYTIQIGLAMFNTLREINWGALMAASCVGLLPPILVFFLGQKQLVEGTKMTGIKG